jgi:F-type H+-transporting ATPase subunit g
VTYSDTDTGPGAVLQGLLPPPGVARLAVDPLEAYGIFSIGEIIGRRNLVGYNLKE